MQKRYFLKCLAKIHFYHHYINIKYFFRNIINRIIGEITIFSFKYLKYKPKELNLYINRNYFGESVYEYVNVLK